MKSFDVESRRVEELEGLRDAMEIIGGLLGTRGYIMTRNENGLDEGEELLVK